MSFLFRKSLTRILSGFETLAADLEKHLEKSAAKHTRLTAAITKIEDEAQRATRVLQKIEEFVA